MRRCEGCGKRFVMDLPVRRAAMFGGAGIVVAVVAGVLVMNLFGAHAAAPQAGDTAVGLGGVTAVQPGSTIPAGALAALRGTTTINGRLAAEAGLLSKAVRAKSFRTSDVVKILRRMAIDARAGTAMLRPMTVWPDAADHQAALATFYNQLARRIDSGLSASVSSAKAYKKSAKSVLATLGAVPDLDTGARTLAGASGVELPAVTIPAALR